VTAKRAAWTAAALALVLGVALAALAALRGEARARPALLVFTTLPIYWNEAAEVSQMLRPGEPPWVRRELEQRHRLVPVDALDAAALSEARTMVMAQPRPLAPAENVVLDDWVAAGGRLLLFADPMLTADSQFPVGDRRRPQAVVLLSPILARWGLRLEFDEAQPSGMRIVGLGDAAGLPVELAGRFAAVPGGRGDARCAIAGDGVIARCRVGRGGVTAIADAALLDAATDRRDRANRAGVLARLESLAFS